MYKEPLLNLKQSKAVYFLANANTLLYNYLKERGDFMAKTANLYARIEPDLKEQAEQILNAIGLPPSSAITMFYKQVVMQQGLPFDARLNYRIPVDIYSITKEELELELEKGYQDAVAGRTKPVDEVFESLNKEFGI